MSNSHSRIVCCLRQEGLSGMETAWVQWVHLHPSISKQVRRCSKITWPQEPWASEIHETKTQNQSTFYYSLHSIENLLNTSYEHPKIPLRTAWEPLRFSNYPPDILLRTFWESSKNHLRIFWKPLKNLLSTSWVPPENLLRNSWNPLCNHLGTL